MPGFSIGNAGGTTNAPPNTLETRRTHRWQFVYLGSGRGSFSQASLLVLKTASRPQFKFEQPEMHHNQEVAYFAGKQTWEPVKLEWYDVEQNPDISATVYSWLETVSNLQTANVNAPSQYKATAQLAMVNGQGQQNELWTMYGTWPASVDWKELDMTNTELQTVSAEMRYDRASRACFTAPSAPYVAPAC